MAISDYLFVGNSTSIQSYTVATGTGVLTFKDSIGNDGRGLTAVGEWLIGIGYGDGVSVYSVDGSGNITLDNTHKQGSGFGYGLWADQNFIYVAAGGEGIHTYSIDSSTGLLTYIDTDDQGGEYREIWGDGRFIYVAVGTVGFKGLYSYEVDGSGNLTYKSSITPAVGDGCFGVWGDGEFILAAARNGGIYSYTVADGTGVFTEKDSDFQTSYYFDVWGEVGGTYIYVAGYGAGIRSYTIATGTGVLTHVDSDFQSSLAHGVSSDGEFQFIANNADGVQSYINVSGVFTFKDSDDQGGTTSFDVWGSSEYIAPPALAINSVEQLDHLDYDPNDSSKNPHWPGAVKIVYTLGP